MQEFFNENLPQELSQPLNDEVVLFLIAESLKRREHVLIRFYYDLDFPKKRTLNYWSVISVFVFNYE